MKWKLLSNNRICNDRNIDIDVLSPPGVDNSEISFIVSKNNVFKCPPRIEE